MIGIWDSGSKVPDRQEFQMANGAQINLNLLFALQFEIGLWLKPDR
jgi:hypothetical protein